MEGRKRKGGHMLKPLGLFRLRMTMEHQKEKVLNYK